MMTLGLSPVLGSAPVSAPAGPNPNLLLWTDELDQASVWTATNCSVVADQDGVADELVSTAPGSALRQVTMTAAAAGAAATATITPSGTAAFAHGEVSGTFDGVLYTFSGEFRDAGGGETVDMKIDRSGGFLRCSLEEPIGDGVYMARHLQLEVGPFTSYQHRGGT